MTTLTLVKFAFNLALVLLGVFAIYKEKELIKFERKVKKYVKAFLKAVYYTILQKKNQKKEAPVVNNIREAEYKEEYEKMLASLNKASRLDDVMVA